VCVCVCVFVCVCVCVCVFVCLCVSVCVFVGLMTPGRLREWMRSYMRESGAGLRSSNNLESWEQ
jgi:hypothetical protein